MGKDNVSAAKPKVGGAVYIAPAGTAIPTDATTALNTAFKSLGYISEDGLTNSNSPEVGEVKAWGGDVVLTPNNSRKDTFQFTLLESIDVNVLKLAYGSDNVSGTLATGIAVHVGPEEGEEHAMVVEMIGKGGVLHRICVASCVLTALGEVSYKDANAVGYNVTLTASADASGFTHHEYYKEP